MGYEPVSLRDSVNEWIKREECKAGDTVLIDLYYRGTEKVEGDYGPYNVHFFSDEDSKIFGLGGSLSIDEQIKKGIDMGTIVKKKTKMMVKYVGQVAKKGQKKVTEKSFKKFDVRMDNSHWMTEEVTPVLMTEAAPEMDSKEEIPF